MITVQYRYEQISKFKISESNRNWQKWVFASLFTFDLWVLFYIPSFSHGYNVIFAMVHIVFWNLALFSLYLNPNHWKWYCTHHLIRGCYPIPPTGVVNPALFSLALLWPPTYAHYLFREEEKKGVFAWVCKLKEEQQLLNQIINVVFEEKVLCYSVFHIHIKAMHWGDYIKTGSWVLTQAWWVQRLRC